MGRVLITGGAGFVGSSLAIVLAGRGHDVVAFDSLRRRGSELNLPRLRTHGVQFVHGDVREATDLESVGEVDVLVDCSAEPSAQAGTGGDTAFVVQSNLVGAYNCLELCRRDDAQFVFLSTSRVYPYAAIDALAVDEKEHRYELRDTQEVPGASASGITEDFPLAGARTLYGATKLAAELLVQEYSEAFGLRAVIDRCAVIAGPWQMGKIDQGVVALWVFHHHFGLPLSYTGYGGTGKQVRDVLHIGDLSELVAEQVEEPDRWAGFLGNVGGGKKGSVSLRQMTEMCAELSGNRLNFGVEPENRPGDVRIFVSDCKLLFERTSWRPAKSVHDVIADLFKWTSEYEADVAAALGLR